MSEQTQESTAAALMREMGLNDAAIARRKTIVDLEPADLARIAAIRDVVLPHVDAYTATFFSFLAGLEEARPLLASGTLSNRAKQLKKEHLAAMVSGDYGS